MGQKLFLKWNDYNTSLLNTFQSLRQERDFIDVTLISDDEIKLQAHKVVLSACSPFFRNVLRHSSNGDHPLLFLSGVQSPELQLVLEYVYNGEVKLKEEKLSKFLEATSKLKISGLSEPQPISPPPTPELNPSDVPGPSPNALSQTRKQEQMYEDQLEQQNVEENMNSANEDYFSQFQSETIQFDNFVSDSKENSCENEKMQNSTEVLFPLNDSEKPVERSTRQPNAIPPAVIVYDFQGNTDLELLDAKIDEFSQKIDGTKEERNNYLCKVCGKKDRDRTGIRTHVETHFKGLSFICDLCEKEFHTREAIRKHKRRHANGGIRRPFNVYGY